jgi:hypothetical protein
MATAGELEQTLRQLAQIGRFVESTPRCRIWEFGHDGRTYRLYHYPRTGRRRVKAAWQMFTGLQRLQKDRVPALHAVALLSGFKLRSAGITSATDDSIIGDAVIVEWPIGAIPLDEYLDDLWQRGSPIPDRWHLALALRSLLQQAGRARLGLREVTLASFVLVGRQLFIADGAAVRSDGLRSDDLLCLAHSARRWMTRTELLRTWRALAPDTPLPRRNHVARERDKAASRQALHNNDRFGKLHIGPWRGIFTRRADHPRRWAPVSDILATAADWQAAWPALLQQITSNELKPIKRHDNGDVLDAQITLGSRQFHVVIKRPARKRLRQYITDALRGSRARRTWIKTWKALSRDLPAEWPLLLMEKRRFGYVIDAVLVFGFVEGPTLASVDLDAMPYDGRDQLMRRTGAVLRRIETLGFTHTDAKSTNWISFNDNWLGPTPIMVDVDGIRHYRWELMGLHRLLIAMRQHPQYTPQDSRALCQGYAPRGMVAPVPPQSQRDTQSAV